MTDNSERRHGLRMSQLIDYQDAAAGHEGVRASQSGDLIVKPCTNAELQFYQETWKADPDESELAYYMPKFYGTLNQQEQPMSAASAAVSEATTAPSISSPTASPTLASTVLISPTGERRHSHISNLSAPGTPKSTGSRAGHGRSPSRTKIISHVPVDESLAPTKPPKSWEPTHGKKIDADTSVVLENVAAGFHKPNILDVKIGARLWADDAHPAKRQKMEKTASETISGSLGFRFAGMKLWAGEGAYERERKAEADEPRAANGDGSRKDEHGLPRPSIREDDYASYDKLYGRAMTKETVRYGFEEYFYRPQAGIKRSYSHEIISRFVDDLKGFIAVMERLETRMYSASLLFVYEGNGVALKKDFKRENQMFREARQRIEQNEQMGPDEETEVNFEGQAEERSPEVSEILRAMNFHQAAPSRDQAAGAAMMSNHSAAEMLPPTILTTVRTNDLPAVPLPAAGGRPDLPAQLGLSEHHFGVESMRAAGIDSDMGEDDDDAEDETLLPKIQAVKLIDFAHASWAPGQGLDKNFISGVRNVVGMLEDMLLDHAED